MTLRPEPAKGIPEETVRVARTAFPKGNDYMRIRDELGVLYEDELFQELFKLGGKVAESPGRLALVTVMQFREGLADRQAADAVRGRIDWKYALGLELTDEGFDFSVLSEFRQRLIEGHREMVLLDKILSVMRERKLLRARGRQRTDSTHVIGAVQTLNRLECVGETLRQALNTLATVVPGWVQSHVPVEWYERYGERMNEWHLPKGADKRAALAQVIGQDGMHVLSLVYGLMPSNFAAIVPAATAPTPTPEWLRRIPAVETLRRVWVQQYSQQNGPDGGCVIQWRAASDLPPGAKLIVSPYDIEVRQSVKRNHQWTGYKLCLTETCEDDAPNLITHVETVPATTPDVALTEPVHTALAVKELLPSEHLVDVGFVNADHLVHSRTQQDVEIVGPVLRNTAWQANSAQGLDVAQFVIDWAAQTVTCPQGHVSHSWVTSYSRGRPVIHVRFGHQDCLACPARAQCTRTQRYARTIYLVPQEQFLALQHARAYQTTEAFKRRYAKRAGIEGTISQAVHAGDSRVSRYIGLAKTHLQHLATAAAINLARIVDWVTCPVKASTRVSRFAALAPATPALIL